MTGTPRRNKGFTLIEVVIGLTVTAMLLVVVYGSLHTGIRAHRSIGATVQDNDETRSVTYFLRRQLRRVETNLHKESLRFSGDRHGLRYALRGLRGDPYLHVLRLQAVPESDPRRLEAVIQRIDEDTARPLSTTMKSRIGGDLRGISFAYFGSADSQTDPAWRDHWEPGEHPPRLVRIRYGQRDGSEQVLFLSVAGADGNQTPRYLSARDAGS